MTSAASVQIRLAPHCSLTPRQAWFFFGTLGLTTFALAGFVAAQGFWLVLPFAGLEIGLLALAVRWSFQRAAQVETITLTEADITIDITGGRDTQQCVFPRHWTRVTLRAGVSPLHPHELRFESKGRSREVGRFLTESERLGLARRLGALVGRIDESPVL
ncbi:MAG: DUF2244 domain-containing protein [Steroidobacteraceae bacterium]